MTFMHACTKQAVTSSSKGKPTAVTPSRKNRGSKIHPAFRGKRSSRRERASTMATAAASVKRVLRTPNHAARLWPRQRQPREARHARSSLQRAVSLHRQFGSFDHGGSHLEQAKCRQFPCTQRGESAQRVGASRSTPASALARLRHFGLSVEIMERVCRSRRPIARFRVYGL